MTIVMPLFILALVLANLLVMVIILGSQRIASPRCGRCSAAVPGQSAQACSACGGRFIEVGIASGSIIRPPKRIVLSLGGLVVSLSLVPVLLVLNASFESFVRSRGNWVQSDVVVLGAANPITDRAADPMARRVEITGQQVRSRKDQPAEILEASITISFPFQPFQGH